MLTAAERTEEIRAKAEEVAPPIRLWCKGKNRDFKRYRVPVRALLLNVDNLRFSAERKLMEELLGRTLDPEGNPEDETSVVSLLLDKSFKIEGDHISGTPTEDSLALKRDWSARGQEMPFWIRPDGTVRNGNRRLAMVKRLQAAQGGEPSWVETIILELDIDEEDLFEMEQREQLTEGFKVVYTDINRLLALRRAAVAKGIDWTDQESIEQVAELLSPIAGGDYSTAYAKVQLYAIRYMDAYLADSNAEGQYQKLLRQVERFRDVGRFMEEVERDYFDDMPDVMRLCFAAIRAGCNHHKIRALRQMFKRRRSQFTALASAIEGVEADHEVGDAVELGDPDLSEEAAAPDTDSEDDDDDGEPGPVVTNYPREQVHDQVINAIDAMKAANSDLLRTLREVFNRLVVVDGDRLVKALAGEDAEAVKKLLQDITDWAEARKGLL